MNRLFSYQVFITLAETKSFTHTATRLLLSQPTVSRIISQLESDLNTVLFLRTTKQFSLTSAGEFLYKEIKPLLASVAIVEDALVAQQTRLEGPVRLTVPMFLTDTLFVLLSQFLIKYPGIKLDLQVTNHYVDLESSGLDVALRVVSDKAILKKTKGSVIPITTRQLVFVTTPSYIEIHGCPNHPQDLGSHNCLVYSTLQGLDDWTFSDKKKEFRVTVSGSLRSTMMLPIKECLLQGVGIACLPYYYVADEINSGKLVSILEPFWPFSQDIVLVITNPSYVSSAVRALVSFLEENLSKLLISPPA